MNQIVKFGANVVLPLLNHVVTGVHFDGGRVTLIFEQGARGDRPQITMTESLTLTDADGAETVCCAQEGTYDVQALASILRVMWTEVVSAHVNEEGLLQLVFSNQMTLQATTVHWQGWAYQGYGEWLEGRCGRWVG